MTLEERLRDEIARLRTADAFCNERLLHSLAQDLGAEPEHLWLVMLAAFDAVADRLEALLPPDGAP